MAAIRPVHFQSLIRVFEQDGFRFDRQAGDHLIYVKVGVRRPLVIPMYRAVPVFIVKAPFGVRDAERLTAGASAPLQRK
jgi:predicted RNA binding protein YcfA (HicA-like mRNA interferase family)